MNHRALTHVKAVRTMVLDPGKAVEANRLLREIVDRVLISPPHDHIDSEHANAYSYIIEGNLPEMIRVIVERAGPAPTITRRGGSR